MCICRTGASSTARARGPAPTRTLLLHCFSRRLGSLKKSHRTRCGCATWCFCRTFARGRVAGRWLAPPRTPADALAECFWAACSSSWTRFALVDERAVEAGTLPRGPHFAVAEAVVFPDRARACLADRAAATRRTSRGRRRAGRCCRRRRLFRRPSRRCARPRSTSSPDRRTCRGPAETVLCRLRQRVELRRLPAKRRSARRYNYCSPRRDHRRACMLAGAARQRVVPVEPEDVVVPLGA